MSFNIALVDDEFTDPDQRATAERRLFTYSAKALDIAVTIDRIFVAHPAFVQSLEALDRAFQLGPALSVPQGVVLTGPTGSGKTSLLRYFQHSLPSSNLFEANLGALSVRLQERPALGRVVSTLLHRLRYPFPRVSDNTVGAKRDILFEAMRQKGTRLVLVDEAGHMCGPGVRRSLRPDDGNEITEFLCELIDEARVALVLSGDQRLDDLSRTARTLAARVVRREQLVDFSMGASWHGFVKTFSSLSGIFDLSYLLADGQLALLHKAAKGNPRRFKALTTEAVLVAVDARRSKLDRATLELAFDRMEGSIDRATNPFRLSRPPQEKSDGTS